MQIGKVIRKYRKEKDMTQEEMAKYLGVTPPAVNKWENGNSYPDITLLAPIARLLGISLDTLLSFQENLTSEEIEAIVREADQQLKTDAYADVFRWAKSIMAMYPNCLELIWQLAVILDAQRLVKSIPDAETYDNYILDCYIRVLKSGDEFLRTQAADSLSGYYLRKEQYDTAEEYLKYYSIQNPVRKLKQAVIYDKTGRREEACKTCEQLLFSGYQILNMAFQNLYLFAMREQDLEKAHLYTDKQQGLARLFEMGKYYEVSCKLELATSEKDCDAVLDIMETMLDSFENMPEYFESKLYSHTEFKLNDSFLKEMKKNLLNCFRNEETYGFLKGNERWQKLMQRQ